MCSKPTTKRPAHCSLSKVSELIDPLKGCWKTQVVEQLFQPQDAAQILRMPLLQPSRKDKLMWGMEGNGLFSVKSAYNLAYSLRRQPACTAETSHSERERRRVWRTVWQLPVKPKLKHFLWKCLHNWLAMGSVMKRRGLRIDETCKRCGLGEETIEHLFFQCHESSLIWKLAPVGWDGILNQTATFDDWWRAICLAKKDLHFQKRVELTIYLLWII